MHGFIGMGMAPPARDYRLYVPRGYDGRRALPLVVWIHGCNQDPKAFAAGTRIARHADERGFLVLLPRQSELANVQRCWNWFDPRTARGEGEAAIVAAQVQAAMAEFAVEAAKVCVAGLSSGAALAAILALRRPDLFAAVALHSGLPCGAASGASAARRAMAEGADERVLEVAAEARARARGARVAALVIHGSRDETVAPANARLLARQFEAFNGSPSELWIIEGLGHAWSGGDDAYPYFERRGPDATRAILDFFAAAAWDKLRRA